MFTYFGYGSNINDVALRAKGVVPVRSEPAQLRGWKLVFNVKHWFPLEGGVGNIISTGNENDVVEGVVHECLDEHLASLDALEAYGVGYDRQLVEVVTRSGTSTTAWTYVGLPAVLDDNCLPSRRYLNIIINGAEKSRLDESYIERLRKHPVHAYPTLPTFQLPKGEYPVYTSKDLANNPHLTALRDAVFDLRPARPDLEVLHVLFGGKDTTLFHLHRHDTSTGLETIDDLVNGHLRSEIVEYLNAYLHEYDREFRFVGRFSRT